MNTYEYRQACRYASKLTEHYRDIVHDAYLDYYNRTGDNLFNAPNRTIITTVKNHYYNSIRRNRFMYRGEYFQKRYFPLTNDNSLIENVTNQEYIEAKFDLYSNSDLDKLIVSNQIEVLSNTLTKRQGYVLDKMYSGYTINDLAEEEGINQSSIRKSWSGIKTKVNLLNLRKQ